MWRRGVKKPAKYRNKRVEYDNIIFASKREMQRYIVLKKAQAKGVIKDLQLQVKFELIPAVKQSYIKHLKTKDKEVEITLQRSVNYIADFVYYKDNEMVVEDVKASPAMIPKEYALKERMMFAFKGIKIKRVYKADEPV